MSSVPGVDGGYKFDLFGPTGEAKGLIYYMVNPENGKVTSTYYRNNRYVERSGVLLDLTDPAGEMFIENEVTLQGLYENYPDLAEVLGNAESFREFQKLVAENGSLLKADGRFYVEELQLNDVSVGYRVKGKFSDGRKFSFDVRNNSAGDPLAMTGSYVSGNISISESRLMQADGEWSDPEYSFDELPGSFPAAALASSFGSFLGRQLAGDDPFAQIALGTALGVTLREVAKTFAVLSTDLQGATGRISAAKKIDGVLNGIPHDIAVAGATAISSFLFAQLVDAIGIGGVPGAAVQSVGGAIIGQIATNLVNGADTAVELFANITNPALIGGAVAGFLGTWLAGELVQFDTVEGQLGASLGSMGAAIVLGSVFEAAAVAAETALITGTTATSFQSFALSLGWAAGPVGIFIGAFVGFLLGGAIGSLFSSTPRASAGVSWDGNEFKAGNAWSRGGGSKDTAISFASQVAETLNGVLAFSGSKLADASAIRLGTYGLRGKKFVYWAPNGTGHGLKSEIVASFSKAADLVNRGVLVALSDMVGHMIGGDVYVKRAVTATLAMSGASVGSNLAAATTGSFSLDALMGNITVARDYGNYLANGAIVDAVFASDSDSAFAAGWLATLAQAAALGLDKRASTDWAGGWNAFLDQVDGSMDGTALTAANLSLQLNSFSHERLFNFMDENGEYVANIGDTIATGSKTLISGTSGNDVFAISGDTISNTNGLTIDGEAANGSAKKIEIAALIDGGEGNDTIRGGDLGNDLLGGAGDDTLVGGKLDDWLIGGDDADRLFAGDVATTSFSDNDQSAIDAALTADGGNGNYLEGGAGADRLYGGKGSDWLAGGAGDDIVLGGAGGDIIDGGAGTDDMRGGAGTDQYVFGLGSGQDSIFDDSLSSSAPGSASLNLYNRYQSIALATEQRNWAGDGDYTVDGNVRGGVDAVSFGAGLDMTNLQLARSGTSQAPGNDLIIKLVAWDEGHTTATLTGDELTLKDWFNDYRRVEWLRFANGEEIRIADIGSTVLGTPGNDFIVGTDGRDFLYGQAGNDAIRAMGGDDYGYGGAGDDFVTGDGGADLILGGLGNDIVQGNAGDDSLSGDKGEDDIFGGDDDDIVSGGLGDDTAIGGAGNDIFKFARGDGHDTVLDDLADSWEVVWDGISQYQNDYVLNGNGTVTKDNVVYFDGERWLGRFAYDAQTTVLKRFLGPVSGNISRDAGDDTIEFAAGINIQDVQLQRQGNDLVLGIAGSEDDSTPFARLADSVSLKDYFTLGAEIEKLAFASTGVHDFSEWAANGNATDGNDSLTGGSGKDWITGLTGDDAIEGGDNADILSGNAGADTLKGGAGDDVIYGGADNDILEGGAGADQLLGGAAEDTASYEAASSSVRAALGLTAAGAGDARGDVYTGIENLRGSVFGDTLIGDDDGNVLTGAGGNDTLRGGLGDDSYTYKLGDGNDVVHETGISGAAEILDASGGLAAGYTKLWEELGPDGGWVYYRLTITEDATGAVIYQSRDWIDFRYTQSGLSERPAADWDFSAGQWKAGTQRTGNNVQVVRVLDGSAGGEDSLLLDDASFSNLAAARDGDDLVLTIGSGQVTIKNQAGSSTAVESLTVMDGVSVSLADLKLGNESATANDDFFLGEASADSFDGAAGHDVISGGGGNDTLAGGAGDDSLEGGAGADTLDGGSDTLTESGTPEQNKPFGDTARYAGSSSAVSIDLAALTASGGDAAGDTIVDVSGVSTIENVTGSEAGGDTLSGDSRGNRLFGLGGDDTLTGRAGDDVLLGGSGNDALDGGDGADNMAGNDGADTLSGGTGNDLLDGGAGDDTLAGGAGDDILTDGAGADSLSGGDGKDRLGAGAGADTLHGDAGDDTLAGGEDADTLYGDAGNDTLSGDSGNDTLQGGDGDDTYTFEAGWGQDILSDAAGTNKIVLSGVSHDKLWLSRIGDNLTISVIGSSDAIQVNGFFAASAPSLLRSIQTADRILFLGHAGALISAMSDESLSAPSQMPAGIADLLANYWHTGTKAAPRVTNQDITADEDTVLTGNIGADDHDDNITGYAVISDAAHGDLTLDTATGAWTYTPDAHYHGEDFFQVQVTDADQQSVTKTVSITLNSVNDAPSDIVADRTLAIDENSAVGSLVANLSAVDPDGPGSFIFTLTENPGNIFQISGSGELTIAVPPDHEAGANRTVAVRVQDQDNLTFTKVLNIAITDVNEAPTNLALTNTTTSIAENSSTASRIKVADLSYSDDALGSESYGLSGADAASFEIDGG
ncbi:MAG TPA: Ig-like domain-containing protein, partial [Rhizomicrobium sp.]|nr:Ig-like domain-containing protein [Rhizomicrobium sp.]